MLVIAALAGLIWGAIIFLRGGLLAGSVTVLLAGCCFGHAFFSVPTGAIPLTADRLLWVVLLVQCIVWRRLGWNSKTNLLHSDQVFVYFLCWLLVSIFSHDWRVNNAMPLSRFVFFFGMPFGLYCVARQAIQSDRSTQWLHAGLAVFGAYLAITAIAET
ncbi:MAG TPA: hypothetical protein VHV77_03620, partial [Pirellulales bacterium]|nr:hypothetical protein [Pirellulales bacterium]